MQDGSIALERESLSLLDDQQRLVIIETRTVGTDRSSPQLIRYQISNHLGSATIELDQEAKLISYEYFPFGSSSYRAVDNGSEIPKRYRYTGKERDDETGLYYRARYYACWLGRWTSLDPSGSAADSTHSPTSRIIRSVTKIPQVTGLYQQNRFSSAPLLQPLLLVSLSSLVELEPLFLGH